MCLGDSKQISLKNSEGLYREVVDIKVGEASPAVRVATFFLWEQLLISEEEWDMMNWSNQVNSLAW